MKKGFNDLTTHNKVLVIAASIKTYYQLTKGVNTDFWETTHYEIIKDIPYE